MTIYLEYIFIENLIMDFIILKETIELAKLKVNNKRIILASIFSSIYVVIMLLFKFNILNYALSKLCLVLCMIVIATKLKNIRMYIKVYFLFFMVSTLNVGVYIVIANIFNITNQSGLEKTLIYIVTYYFTKTFISKLWKLYKVEINKRELNYTVELKIGEKIYTYIGFLDTGNTVYSHGLPVIFAEITDEKLISKLTAYETFNVKTVTLGSTCSKKAYVFDKIKISNKTKTWLVKAAVVFENRRISRLNNYNMILNYILYTDSMGGIEI